MPNGKINCWVRNEPALIQRITAVIRARWKDNPIEFFNPRRYQGIPDPQRFVGAIVAVVTVDCPEIAAAHRTAGYLVVEEASDTPAPAQEEVGKMVLVYSEEDNATAERLRNAARRSYPGHGLLIRMGGAYSGPEFPDGMVAVICSALRWRIIQGYRARGMEVVPIEVNAGTDDGTPPVPTVHSEPVTAAPDPAVLDAMLTLDEDSFTETLSTQADPAFLRALAEREQAAANRVMYQALIDGRLRDLGGGNRIAEEQRRAALDRAVPEGGELQPEAPEEPAEVPASATEDAAEQAAEAAAEEEDPELKRLRSISYGQVSGIIKAIRSLKPDQLRSLLALEEAGQRRATVVRAIKAEMVKRGRTGR